MTKTHYRKAFNNPYLASADLLEPVVLTISHVVYEADKRKSAKHVTEDDYFNTAYFVEREIREGEKLKPMILNAGNSEIIKNRTGSKILEEWHNIPVTVFAAQNVRSPKGVGEGLRIDPNPPKLTKPLLTPERIKPWNNAKAAYKRDGNLDEVKKHMDISEDHEMQLVQECSE